MKVTPTFLLVHFIFLVGGLLFGQEPVPVKIDDHWAYQSGDTKEILIDHLEYAQPYRNGIGIAKRNGHWGAFNVNLELFLPFEYEALSLLTTELIKGKKAGLYELFDFRGKTIGPGPFMDLNLMKKHTDTLIVANQSGLYGLMDKKGKILIPLKYAQVPEHLFGDDLLTMQQKKDNYFTGVVRTDNKILVPFKYLFVQKYGDQLYKCETIDRETYVYYDRNGKQIYKHKKGVNRLNSFDSLSMIILKENEQELTFRSTGKKYTAQRWIANASCYFGTNKDKNTVVIYRNGRSFIQKGEWRLRTFEKEMLHAVSADNKSHALWRTDGTVVYLASGARILNWTDRWAVITNPSDNRTQVLIDLRNGNRALPTTHDQIELMSCNYVQVKDGDQSVLYDDQLDPITPDQYANGTTTYFILSEEELKKLDRIYLNELGRHMKDDITSEKDCNHRMMSLDNVTGIGFIMNPYGDEPLPNRLRINIREENVYKVGILDFQGKVIVPPLYNGLNYHYDGLIPFSVTDTLDYGRKAIWGIMDADGKILLEPRYSKIDVIEGNRATVSDKGLFHLIDINTKETLISGYEYIQKDEYGYYHVKRFGLHGIVDDHGNVLVPLKYTEIHRKMDDGGLYKAFRNREGFYVDLNGNEFPIE